MVYSDPDPHTGFVLVPDMKWDQKGTENLYMQALVRRKGILSMRELSGEHLPLLKNILHHGKVWCILASFPGPRAHFTLA